MTNETQIADLKAEIAATKLDINSRLTANINLAAQIKNNLAMNRVDEKIIGLKEGAINLLSVLSNHG